MSAILPLALAAAIVSLNPKLTPGAVFPTATAAVVCRPGYAATVRNVSPERKRAACLRYGIKAGCPGRAYEIDHLISLELGGSNDDRNLWPEEIGEARRKDALEDSTHREVCAGRTTLREAQAKIAKPGEWP